MNRVVDITIAFLLAGILLVEAQGVTPSGPAIFDKVPKHTGFKIERTSGDALHMISWPVVTVYENGGVAVDWARVERDVAATPPKDCLTRDDCVIELLISRVRAGKVKDISRGSK